MNNSKRVVPITVAISCKDRFDELKETVRSVCDQTILPDEVIIVDDCSTVPVTLEMFDLGKHPLRIRIFRNDPNLGGAASLNFAVKQAANGVVAFLDSDDCFARDYIARISARWFSQERPKSALAVGFFWCDDNLNPYRVQIAPPLVSHAEILASGNIVGGSSIISVDRDAYLSVGGYPALRGSHDWGLLIRMSAVAPIQTIQEPLVYYRSPTTSPVDNLTRAYVRQVGSLLKLFRSSPLHDRPLLRPRIRRLNARHLALAGRTSRSWKILLSVGWESKRPDIELLQTTAINVLGPRNYARLLRKAAVVRAKLYSSHRKGLAK